MPPIPRRIHYVSLGDYRAERPEVIDACTQSVRLLHPAWKIRYHNETNIGDLLDHPQVADIGCNAFYEAIGKHYKGLHSTKAIQSDLLKILAVYCYGGFVIDLDMYSLQPLDKFRDDEVVVGTIGGMKAGTISEAIIGARAGDKRIGKIIRDYVNTQRPGHGEVNLHLPKHCKEMGITPYDPTYFIPHWQYNFFALQPGEYSLSDLAKHEENKDYLYVHSKDTHMIHLWRQHNYDLKRLQEIGKEVNNYE